MKSAGIPTPILPHTAITGEPPVPHKTKMSHTFAYSPLDILTPRSRPAHPIRRWLWKGTAVFGALLLVFMGSDMTARWRDPSPKLALGHDLLPSYAAGQVVREGRAREMYDRPALTAVEQKIIQKANLDIDGRFGPWLNPPFYAWAFVPLSALPYRTAAAIFLVFNLMIFSLSLWLLSRILVVHPTAASCAATKHEPIDWRTLALVPILILIPLPFWQVMGHQQNTFISLLLLVGTVICWRGNKPVTAGAIAGLLFFKPQLGAVLACVLIADVGWRALVGLGITGVALLLITLITMPGCLSDYLHRLPPMLHWLQNELPYNWGRQVTFQSFWRLLLQGQVRGETILIARVLTWVCSGLVAQAMIGVCIHFRRGPRDAISRDRLIAAAIASMPVLMPYYMDYDLLLLAVPAILLAAEWIREPAAIRPVDCWLLFAWVTFCLESHFNPGIAGHSRFNPAVPLLFCMSILQITRCVRDGGARNVEM